MQRTKFNIKDGWYIAVDYLPSKFSPVKGPFQTKEQVMQQTGTQSDSIIKVLGERKTVHYKWRNDKWEERQIKRIKIWILK